MFAVAHQNHRDAARKPPPRSSSASRDARPGGQGARVPARVDDRAVGERIGVGHAKLDHVRSGLRARLADEQRVRERGKPRHHVGHQSRALAAVSERVCEALDAGARRPCSAPHASPSTSGQVLCPPDRERQMRSSSPCGWSSTQARRVGLVSSAGYDARRGARHLAEGGERVGVVDGHVARPAGVPQERVLGPGARIVKPRRRIECASMICPSSSCITAEREPCRMPARPPTCQGGAVARSVDALARPPPRRRAPPARLQ